MAKETRHPFRRRAERPSRRHGGGGARTPPPPPPPPPRLPGAGRAARGGGGGRTPLREELPPCLRIGLADAFGSLRSAFLQLDRHPLSRQEVRLIRQKNLS